MSITSVWSKIFERLLAIRPTRFSDTSKLLHFSQFGFRKDLSSSDALITITHDVQVPLDARYETRLISLDFISAFDRDTTRLSCLKSDLLELVAACVKFFPSF